jgi:hypothetical protein
MNGIRFRFALFMLLLGSAACVATSTSKVVPEITFASNNFPIYSSASRSVSRQMCRTLEVVTLPAEIPQVTLERIANLAEQSGFFALVAEFAEPKPRLVVGDDGEEYTEILVSSPCWTTSLEIAYDGKKNRIAWSCMGDAIANSRPEVAALREALAPHLDKLPRQPCFLR